MVIVVVKLSQGWFRGSWSSDLTAGPAAILMFGELKKEISGGEAAPGEGIDVTDWIRHEVVTLYHPTSTCAMGGTDASVCDPELRVRGVDGLRVVDASVMPAVPRGTPMGIV